METFGSIAPPGSSLQDDISVISPCINFSHLLTTSHIPWRTHIFRPPPALPDLRTPSAIREKIGRRFFDRGMWCGRSNWFKNLQESGPASPCPAPCSSRYAQTNGNAVWPPGGTDNREPDAESLQGGKTISILLSASGKSSGLLQILCNIVRFPVKRSIPAPPVQFHIQAKRNRPLWIATRQNEKHRPYPF